MNDSKQFLRQPPPPKFTPSQTPNDENILHFSRGFFFIVWLPFLTFWNSSNHSNASYFIKRNSGSSRSVAFIDITGSTWIRGINWAFSEFPWTFSKSVIGLFSSNYCTFSSDFSYFGLFLYHLQASVIIITLKYASCFFRLWKELITDVCEYITLEWNFLYT